MKIVITGGGGFVGSHAVRYFAAEGHEVTAIDSFCREEILGRHFLGPQVARYNWNGFSRLRGVRRIEQDVRSQKAMDALLKDADAVIHTAAQVAVTTSVVDPRTDFDINVDGTVNVLEAARKSRSSPAIVFCSTNKVYGNRVNDIPVRAHGPRYEFDDPSFATGIPERFGVDLVHHTPYGASKLAADLYLQEYAHSYGLPTAVFRMSCIYGPRQFGMEDQGWVAHFALSAFFDRPVTIYGDGKQVRDVLYVDDLIRAYATYLERSRQLGGRVYNIGGGPSFTMSLLELLSQLEENLGRKLRVSYEDWRPADQRVYVTDISKVRSELGWSPSVGPAEGVRRILAWLENSKFHLPRTRNKTPA